MILVDMIGVIPFLLANSIITLNDLPGDMHGAGCQSIGVSDAVCHGISRHDVALVDMVPVDLMLVDTLLPLHIART